MQLDRGATALFLTSDMTTYALGNYVMLKHLPPWRKLVASLYSFFVGDDNTWGLAGVARQMLLGKQRLGFVRVLGPSLASKLAGPRNYRAMLRDGFRTPGRPGAGGAAR